LARIQATAADVSRPPENAIPTRSPMGSDVSTLADIVSDAIGLAHPSQVTINEMTTGWHIVSSA
jgi:hypothetical protein